MNVFIVDDNKDNADLLAELIINLGYTVEIEYDSAKAFNKIIDFQPSIIFMDILMPEINGFSLARIIKNHKKLYKTRIVAVTGLDRNAFKDLAISMGFDDYFVKPVNLNTIQNILENTNIPRFTRQKTGE